VEHNRLLVAAGYAPISLVQLGTWTDTLQAVIDVLNDREVSPDERAEFGKVVESIAAHWRRQEPPGRGDFPGPEPTPPEGSPHPDQRIDSP
jgi:hypothetical protein